MYSVDAPLLKIPVSRVAVAAHDALNQDLMSAMPTSRVLHGFVTLDGAR